LSPLALSIRFLQSQPDERLVALAADGHERAFEALVRRHRRALLAYARRVTPPDANPEDTLQQALLQAWTALSAGAQVRDVRAWLHRIVHNVAVTDLRRPRAVVTELRHAASAAHVVEQRLAVREALAGLASLPDLQREVMVGTAVDGMSHEELASALGLSSGAVRGLIYRARAALRSAAAAVIPSPVVHWAVRHGSDPASRPAKWFEAAAGGGSAGLAGVVMKGGAVVVAAGALATAAGIGTHPQSRRHGHSPPVQVRPIQAVQAAATSAAGGGRSSRTAAGSPGSATRGGAPAGLAEHRHDGDGPGDGDRSRHGSSREGGGSPQGGGSHEGEGGGGSTTSGSSRGTDGGSGQISTGSHDGGGSGGGTSGSGGSGSDGGSSGTSGTSGTSGSGGGGSDGGTSGTSGSGGSGSDGGHDGALTTTVTTSSSDGGSGSRDGSGDVRTTTTTSP
jgi:RNA polymerase sigma factor (sigma-70 family)